MPKTHFAPWLKSIDVEIKHVQVDEQLFLQKFGCKPTKSKTRVAIKLCLLCFAGFDLPLGRAISDGLTNGLTHAEMDQIRDIFKAMRAQC